MCLWGVGEGGLGFFFGQICFSLTKKHNLFHMTRGSFSCHKIKDIILFLKFQTTISSNEQAFKHNVAKLGVMV